MQVQARLSVSKTMQKYDMFVAVFEFSRKKNKSFVAVILVIWSFGQNRFQSVKIRHYIINILIFIYSEQMTESENENDHFDLDQNDHAFWRACIFRCQQYQVTVN